MKKMTLRQNRENFSAKNGQYWIAISVYHCLTSIVIRVFVNTLFGICAMIISKWKSIRFYQKIHFLFDYSLQKLSAINAEMNKKFLKFIAQCLYFDDENMELVKIGKLIPQPRINLAFENGKIGYWNGK